MAYQRLIYMTSSDDLSAWNSFLDTLWGPQQGQHMLNASSSGQEPKTHCVGSTPFIIETELNQVLDWYSQHPSSGCVYATYDDYVWAVAWNEWGLRLVEEPV